MSNGVMREIDERDDLSDSGSDEEMTDMLQLGQGQGDSFKLSTPKATQFSFANSLNRLMDD